MTIQWHRYVGAELYSTVGAALVQWQHVEVGLLHVFERVTQMPNFLIASAVYFSPLNFNDKLRMVDSAAAFALFDTAHSRQWNKLKNEIQRKSHRRNQIAHFMSIHDSSGDGSKSRLQPNFFDAKSALYWHTEGRLPQYSPKQLCAMTKSFGRLANKLEDFARDLAGLTLPSPDKSPLSRDRPTPEPGFPPDQSAKAPEAQPEPSPK